MQPIPTKTEDPRSPLERIRRFYLRKILLLNKIPHKPDLPASDMRRLIQSNGVDIGPYITGRINLDTINIHDIDFQQPVKIGAQQEPKNIDDMNFFELKRILKSLGVPFNRTDTAKDLKKKLMETMNDNAPTGG